jgi:hypothetical protein
MSKFQEFCESFLVGKAKAEADQLQRDEECRTLPLALAKIFQRMCDYFQCPPEKVHYVELEANTVANTVQDGVPPVGWNPESCRKCLALEIGIAEHPVWLYFEFVPLKHDGFEFHFDSTIFQIPAEEKKLFDHVAETINQELRKSYTPMPRKIGFQVLQ